MADSALILGGYGAAGIAIARLLLRETPLGLVLGGRDGDRAGKAAAELDDEYGEGRVRGLRVDATDPGSLADALRGCDLVVVCMPIEGIAAGVARAAIEAGVDWIDISLGVLKQQALRDLAPEIERSGRCFITEAGAVPGLPSAVVRLAADRFDQLHSAFVSIVMKASAIALGSALDMLRQVATPAFVYQEGAWCRASIMATRRVDFGEPFGEQSCFPMDMVELRDLPERLGVKRLGSYGAGGDPAVDAIAMVFALGKLGKLRSAVGLGAKLMVWANRRFTKPPYGVKLKLEAEGTIDGDPSRLDVLLGHDDGYEITAIPLVASVLQLLGGSARSPGLHHMGSAVDPRRLLDDMRRLGLRVSGI
jgi:saccharopine dehydrogenase (NAD+, L-lysine-forming)